MTEVDPRQGARDLVRATRVREFDAQYASTPPWDIGRPQQALQRLADTGQLRGGVLDVGCGTGEHALMAARLGLETTAIDTAPTAIDIATRKAHERGLTVRFLVADALELSALGTVFETVLDCGLFHIFDDDDRLRYVDSLRAAIRPGGRFHMLCFSDREPGDWGPRRVHPEEIEAAFSDGWLVDSIEADTLEVTITDAGVAAWLASITRA